MSLLRCVHSTLLTVSRRPAALTVTRMYAPDYQKWMAVRRRRLEEKGKGRGRIDPPECLLDPCGWEPLPMDLDHYTPSDKALRKYQRTWCDCFPLPRPAVKRTKKYPQRKRRKPIRPPPCTEVECRESDLNPSRVRGVPEKLIDLPCGNTITWPCCKLNAPGCKPGRRPPTCLPTRIAICCKKRRCQYPSFSECKKGDLLEPILPCECEKKVNLCDVWAYWRKQTEK
ncbi:uncharacterized protein Dana_GF13522 [Drosophila ananassae]|uniref:Uncharacterized protein n=1 Tax=Drosophila ananassae TaxID=7217 RepID=B3MEG5_DROAN|nr:uncharacterized protein LOC6496361 [Drosophila ananassae]EDV37585.1 uncharacterized protein Dana_GF13522 [Drosophila ananassae]